MNNIYIIIVSLYLIILGIFNIKKQKIVPLFFNCGSFLYLVLPLIILENKVIVKKFILNAHIFDKYYYKYDIDNFIIKILVFIIVINFLFSIFYKIRIQKYNKVIPIKNITIKLTLSILYLMLGLIYFINRNSIISGYRNYGNFRGGIAAILLMSLTLNIYFLLKEPKNKNIYFKLHLLLSLPLVLMGTRMYFLITVISYLYVTIKIKKIKKTNVIIVVFVLFIFFCYISVWRLQGNSNGLKNSIYEFLYTGISYITFLGNNEIPFFSFPHNLINSSITLIPSFIRGNINFIKESEFIYMTPMGAKNIFVSLIENFGYIGSFFLIALMSRLISLLQYRSDIKYQAIYYVIAGAIPFLFFRDPLNNFLYKICFEYTYLFLLIIEFIDKVLLKKSIFTKRR